MFTQSWPLGYPCRWLTMAGWNEAHTVAHHCRGMQQCRPGSQPLSLVFQNFWHCLHLLRVTKESTENKKACGWNQWDLLWQKFRIYEKHVAILHTARREFLKNLTKEFYPPTSFKEKRSFVLLEHIGLFWSGVSCKESSHREVSWGIICNEQFHIL